ncbi:MAG: L-glutamate gamma-semialdehyde dehydrogenase [Bacteroidales bacterium]
MNQSIFSFPRPTNEPILSYKPGSPERAALQRELDTMAGQEADIPLIIGGKEIRTGNRVPIVMPHNHSRCLGYYHLAGEAEITMAIEAALAARERWSRLPWTERASVLLKAAELMTKKYRFVLNAATMLGQSKNPHQAEIDAVCEIADFLRFNAYFASQIYADQPYSEPGVINRMAYRPLEGFVFAVSPFNFTSIAGNLNAAPVLMGNVTVWKPSSTSVLSNYWLMKIFQEAGVPDGVINFVPSKGSVIGQVVFRHPQFAGVHFTGSTGTFNHFWKLIGDNISNYRSYPRIVGETGGKDFVVVHPSAPVRESAVALVRGAFEYQGQKCSAASRAYVARSLWPAILAGMKEMVSALKMGDVCDFSCFFNAVIDEASYNNIAGYISAASQSATAKVVLGGRCDNSKGWFVEPTVILTSDPDYPSLKEEIFGPVLTVYLYDDHRYEEALELCNQTSPYALTGSVLATDRYAIELALEKLENAAGNFYINDKPTGAVVGQQPFGGARASGTNDKAGSYLNLLRWVNAQTIKETFAPATSCGYDFLKEA